MDITPEQIRAARALVRLDQAELARRAKVSVVTIRRVEAPSARDRVAPSTLGGIRMALEEAGAEFIPDGVRRRRPVEPMDTTLFEDLRAISLRSVERLRGLETIKEADLYDEDGLPG